MPTQETMSSADMAFIKSFEGVMNFFSRLVGTEKQTSVSAQELRDAFNYLRTIDPQGAEDLLQCFRHCANDPESSALCPSELPACNRESFMARTEIAIRGAEQNAREQFSP